MEPVYQLSVCSGMSYLLECSPIQPPWTPTENPGQESFFGRFKDEWKDEIWELKSFTEVKRFIDKKIRYYNNKRLHTSIGYQTPAAYTKSVLKCLR